ncbi:hypothetical protein [Streptosporangium sp. NPDC000396]|uniref:hypothetical protein n=1 Tax=Streptosporangium sp. NPDC000396 TaxID=3366185 RepID=UPI0036B37580
MSPIPQQPGERPQRADSDHVEAPGEATEPTGAVDPGPPTEPASVLDDTPPPSASRKPEPALAPATAGGARQDPEATNNADGTSNPGEEGGARAGSRAWRGRLVGAVVAMAFAATAATAVLQWRAADRLAEEKAERDAVSARAGEFAVALQTYDYANLQAYRDQVFAISGEDFEKTYNEAFSPLEGVITSMKASSSASVRGVYVSEVGEGRAKAITVVDSQVTSTAGTRRMLGTYMELGLIKTGGHWKVNDATVMGAAEELVTDPNGKAVEPTPEPSPTTSESTKKTG